MWKLLPLLLCLSTEHSWSFGLTFVQSHCTFWLSGSLIPCWNPKGNLHRYPQWCRGVGNGRSAFCYHSPAMEKATQWKNASLQGCGKSMLALICWTGPLGAGNFSHCSLWMLPSPSFPALLPPRAQFCQQECFGPYRLCCLPKERTSFWPKGFCGQRNPIYMKAFTSFAILVGTRGWSEGKWHSWR